MTRYVPRAATSNMRGSRLARRLHSAGPQVRRARRSERHQESDRMPTPETMSGAVGMLSDAPARAAPQTPRRKGTRRPAPVPGKGRRPEGRRRCRPGKDVPEWASAWRSRSLFGTRELSDLTLPKRLPTPTDDLGDPHPSPDHHDYPGEGERPEPHGDASRSGEEARTYGDRRKKGAAGDHQDDRHRRSPGSGASAHVLTSSFRGPGWSCGGRGSGP